MPSIGELIDVIESGPDGDKLGVISLMGVEWADMGKVAVPSRSLQWWPETFRDAIEIGWQKKGVLGGSHSLYSWTENGGRVFSFDVVLTQMLAPPRPPRFPMNLLPDSVSGALEEDPKSGKNAPFNADVKSGLRWLRSFGYPRYTATPGEVHPPPLVVLNVPGAGLAEDGGDTFFAVMTECEVTYEKFFADGTPKIATVSLSFGQVVQSMGGVSFAGREVLSEVEGGIGDGYGREVGDAVYSTFGIF